jgi:hypothetical protein
MAGGFGKLGSLILNEESSGSEADDDVEVRYNIFIY